MLKQEIQCLYEGVRFFKLSSKIENAVIKISKSKASGPEKTEIIDKLTKAYKDFKEAETEYAIGNKDKGKSLYKIAKIKHAAALKKISDKAKIFLVTSGLALVVVAITAFLFKVPQDAIASNRQTNLEDLWNEFKLNSGRTFKDAENELYALKNGKDQIYYYNKFQNIVIDGKNKVNLFADRVSKNGGL